MNKNDELMIGSRYELLPGEWGTITAIRGIGAAWGPVIDLDMDDGIPISHLGIPRGSVA